MATSDLHGQLWSTDYTADYSKMGTIHVFQNGMFRQTGRVFTGHAHDNKDVMIANAAGEEIPVVAEFTKARVIGDVTIDYNKANGD